MQSSPALCSLNLNGTTSFGRLFGLVDRVFPFLSNTPDICGVQQQSLTVFGLTIDVQFATCCQRQAKRTAQAQFW